MVDEFHEGNLCKRSKLYHSWTFTLWKHKSVKYKKEYMKCNKIIFGMGHVDREVYIRNMDSSQ